jgi:glycosyltransferase involved in cell wall biosynthesis
MTKTIAFFNGFYLPHLGGVERYTYNLANALVARGHRVIVVTVKDEEDLADHEVVNGVEIFRLPIWKLAKSRYPFLKFNATYRQLKKQIDNITIDIYVANTRFHIPALYGMHLARKVGKTPIVIEHGTTWLSFGNKLLDFFLKPIERILMTYAKWQKPQFYGVSQAASEWLSTFGVKASGVLYNAVDWSTIEEVPISKRGDEVLITYAGRLQPVFKGVEMLLIAFEALAQDYPQVRLAIAGDGPIYDRIKTSYTNHEQIAILGRLPHDQVLALEAQSDIFVLMSQIEGFSTAMLEAAALENVVITTEVGGARELIPTDAYGYVIARDAIKLRQVLENLVQAPEKMRAIQKRVAARVRDHYTWDHTAQSFETQILGGQPDEA